MENKSIFDEKNVVLSFGAISDVHVNHTVEESAEKLRRALMQLSVKAGIHGKGLDAVCVAGDLIDHNANVEQIKLFRDTYESVLSPDKVQLVYALGNHDVKWVPEGIEGEQIHLFEQLFGEKYFEKDLAGEEARRRGEHHFVIQGYHFLTVVPKSNKKIASKDWDEIWEILCEKTSSREITYYEETKKWLDETLQKVTGENPGQYVFLLTHPMITDTCYGSDMGDFWETLDLTEILEKYPQVVTFGGHLHFSINDERSIMQKDFTALGCGSVRYMAVDAGKYEDMQSKTVMSDAHEVSSGLLVQLDIYGNMQITRMNFKSGTGIKDAWVVKAPSEDREHLRRYSPARGNAENNAAPVMNGGAEIIVNNINFMEKEAKLIFDAGTDDDMIHHYVITYGEKGCEEVFTKKILADFYLCDRTEDMKRKYILNMGKLERNKAYQGYVYCVDSWDAESNKVFFEIERESL